MPDISLLEQTYETVPVESLHEHPRNARRGDTDAIQNSASVNGFYGALVVQRSTGRVLVGNHRLRVLRAAGVATVPVLYVDVDDDRALKILLADNRTSDQTDYDKAALLALLQDVEASDEGLDGTGYDDDDITGLLHDATTHFQPNLEPTVYDRVVTPEQIAKAAVALADASQTPPKILDVLCPHCGQGFGVQPP